MNSTWTVSCGSCDHSWHRAGNWSEYERQAVESRPCPRCGAYTLQSPEPGAAVPVRRTLLNMAARMREARIVG